MSVKIRLARGGAKKRPYYRIVVADSRSPRDGRFIEKVGTYNPMLPKADPGRVIFDKERMAHWLSQGAVPTERVLAFFEKAGFGKEFKQVTDALAKRNKVIELKKKEHEAKKKAEEEARKAEEAAKKAEEEAAKKAEEEAAAAAAAAPAEEAKAEEEAPAEEKQEG